jgi:hypothetical protein
MRRFLAELWQRDNVLTATGWLMFAAAAIMAAIAPFDSRTITGVNAWLKPIRFCLSVGIYLWSVAWFLGYLTKPRWAVFTIRWGVALLMIGEIYLITSQAARGVTSHYNVSTAFDLAVFSMMAGMIVFNTVLDALLLALFFQRGLNIKPALLWGIRLGLVFFILGSLEGITMINNGAHTVGAPDGGPGLPFLDWSTIAGDLRIAHMMGIHSLQVIPIYGAFISHRMTHRPVATQVALVTTFALVYAALTYQMFARAMTGRSLVAM